MEQTPRSRALVTLLRPNLGRWVGLALIVAVASGLSLAAPLVVRTIVDATVDGTDGARIRALALIFLAIVVAGQGATIWVARAATQTAWGTTNRLRMDMVAHVLGLDHEFHRRHSPGELISRVDGDVTYVSDFLGKVLPKALGALLVVTGMLGVLVVIDWRLGLAMALYLVVAFWFVLRGRHRSVAEAADEMGANAKLYGGIEERLNAVEDIRSNGAGDHAMWRFVEDSAGVMDSSIRRQAAYMGMWWSVQGALTVGTAIALAGGAFLAERGTITIGTAFLLFQYVRLVSRPLEEVVHELETVQKASGAMRRVLALLDLRPTMHDDGTTSPPDGALSVRCRHVRFDYGDLEDPDAPPVLLDLDVDIGAGHSVGIVGRTGSGKTTFSRLVLRLVDVTGGRLELGGIPISEIPMSELRRRVALVPQEVELFSGTLRDNVTLFDPAPSDDDVVAALRAVGLETLVDGGIDRDLGAGGAGLSAGEAQLLAMARVWLRNPDLVVLDEATARVDPDTERRIEDAVRHLMVGRTTLIIAHRLSTLREVDDIMVFDAGTVVEAGARVALEADPESRFSRLLDLAGEGVDPGEVAV